MLSRNWLICYLTPPNVPSLDVAFLSKSARLSSADALLHWHQRLGHRNFKEVASLLGVPLPTSLPVCVSCIKGKSRRQPLPARSDPIHEPIRPGYAFQWDHAGPFTVRSWGGNNYLSVMICTYSGYTFARMTNTLSSASEEWQAHVRQLEASRGKLTVARMITDSAAYFRERQLEAFNEERGIIHVQSPPYTQELNGLAERTLGTLFGMTRSSLDAAGAPEQAAGECLVAMCHVLNRLPFRSGGRLSRLELWKGQTIPTQRDRLRVWGSAAFVHTQYGSRGAIGPTTKFAPRSEMHVFVGYDPNGMGYRVARLPDFQIRTAIHVTIVEDIFPCRTTTPRNTPHFLSSELEERYRVQQALPEPYTPRGRPLSSRPERNRTLSASALEAIANGPPSAPDTVNATIDASFPAIFDTVHVATGDPSSFAEAIRGPEAANWLHALQREYDQHLKNGTFGPAVDPSDLPQGLRPIPFDVIFKLKRDGRYKARGIIKGFWMKAGRDFNETFAPIPCLTTLRFLLGVAAKYDWEIKAGDVHTAFLCSIN